MVRNENNRLFNVRISDIKMWMYAVYTHFITCGTLSLQQNQNV